MGTPRRRAHGWKLALVLMLAATVPLGTVAARAQAAPELRGHLNITPLRVIYGEDIRAVGGLPVGNRVIQLQRKSGTSWVEVARKQAQNDNVVFVRPARNVATTYRLWSARFTLRGVSYGPYFSRSVQVVPVAQRATLTIGSPVDVGEGTTATAEFLPARPGRPISLQRKSGDTWTTLTTKTAGKYGKAQFAVATPSKGTFTYRARAAAYEGAPAFLSPTAQVTVKDVTPPAAPTGVVATGSAGAIHLDWNPVSAADLAGYRVQRFLGFSTDWQPAHAGLVTATEMDFVVDEGSRWTFRVAAVDTSGNASAWSAVDDAVAVGPDTTPPPKPTGLTGTPGNGQVLLEWTGVSAPDLDGYRVYRGPSATGPWQAVGSTTSTSSTVGSLTNGTSYWFAVSSADELDNESDLVVVGPVTPSAVDSTAPPVPTGVSATGGHTTVQVSWTAVSAADLAGYRVYRGPSASGPWTEATTNPVGGTTFQVTGLTNGTTYWFAVSSEDVSGNESARSTAASATPSDGGVWKQLSAGHGHVCGVKNNGQLWCWGNGGSGQLGGGLAVESAVSPTRVGSASDWLQVDAGGSHTCALKSDGRLFCWGSDTNGQQGNGSGSADDLLSPTQVQAGTTWSDVSAGQTGTCAVRTDHTLWCWGRNDSKQLGFDSGGADVHTPTQLGSLTTWATVTIANTHACGSRTDGSAWCWGDYGNGQLGHSSSTGAVGQVTSGPWSLVSPGGTYFGCGIKTTGTLWCWGYSFGGQTGGTGDGNTKAQIDAPAATWSRLSTGSEHSCAVRSDGQAWCWGRSDFGQLGSGTTNELKLLPVAVSGNATWRSVTAGDNHTCGIRTDGSGWCWGNNGSGQVGDGTTDTRWVPVSIDPVP